MKLDRNTNPDGHGKYALIKLRSMSGNTVESINQRRLESRTHMVNVPANAIDFGDTPDTEFFVIRLKDKNAANALMAYSVSCRPDDPEFANEVHNLALKAAAMNTKQKPT